MGRLGSLGTVGLPSHAWLCCTATIGGVTPALQAGFADAGEPLVRPLLWHGCPSRGRSRRNGGCGGVLADVVNGPLAANLLVRAGFGC